MWCLYLLRSGAALPAVVAAVVQGVQPHSPRRRQPPALDGIVAPDGSSHTAHSCGCLTSEKSAPSLASRQLLAAGAHRHWGRKRSAGLLADGHGRPRATKDGRHVRTLVATRRQT